MIEKDQHGNFMPSECRVDFDNRYHKVRADIGIDTYQRIWNAAVQAAINEFTQVIADYEEVLADKRRLVRDMDRMINGEKAARQASLCDLLPQVKALADDRDRMNWLAASTVDWSWDPLRHGGELTIDNREGLDCRIYVRDNLRDAIDVERR